MAELEQTEVTPPPASGKKDRSPSFPFITLTKAVERARELFTAAKRHEMRLPDAAAAMNYGAKSSGAIQTLAALIAYGLVEDSGSGDARKFRISDLGFKTLEDERPGAREGALAQAATAPKLIAEYLPMWGEGRPADGICISELRIDRGFTEDGAASFLRVFDDAMTYAKAGGSDKASAVDSEKGGQAEPPGKKLNVGDWVCVVAGGQVVYDRTRVRAIDPPWVFVEASQAGAKMEDVTLLERGPKQAEPAPILPFATLEDTDGTGVEMDRFTVDEGVVKLTFPSDMTTDSVEELEEFFKLFIKKAKRRAGAEKAAN